MLDAVLFDLDGVLVDSKEAWYLAVAEAGVRFRGRAISRAEFDPTFGQGTEADVPLFGLDCTTAQLDRFYEEEFVRQLNAVKVDESAKKVLTALKASGLKLAVVTNSVAVVAHATLRHAGLIELFDSLATADRVPASKPAPDLPLLALKELHVDASRALFIGDSRFDREAAAAAGVRFVGLRLGHTADRIDRLSDLPERVSALVRRSA
jgi:phosphoglycolate phosphatase/AHBA synthesis associated protein